ncbi:hypothetical protein BBJ28_00019985 [Nothophytophthora sp. Chile5]|nr:hypothetical protein BBJ28_00019985 [Nothophytophthora sp. Chile5]
MEDADQELDVRRAFYLLLHAEPLQDGVEVRASKIAGAGQGLFATQKHVKDAVVCEYMGIVWPNRVAWKLEDKSYLMKLGDGKYVDALHSPQVLARYINDCLGRRGGFNVRFEKQPSGGKADVVALRDIQPGEELYVDYGRMYWLAYNLMHPDSPVR